jgi:hypothetical protein
VRLLLLTCFTLSLCAAGCAPTLSPGAPCAFNSDCDAPLLCRNARCRIACVEARDCGPGLRCVQAAEGPSCTIESEESCDAANPCPGALRCVFGQCRSECITDGDCSRDGVCDADGSCLEARSGLDASVMRMDAGPPPDAPACTPAPMVCASGIIERCDPGAAAAVRALTGTDGGELEFVTHTISGIVRPREGSTTLAPEIALGLSGTDYGIIGYLGDGEERRAHFERFPLIDIQMSAPVDTAEITEGRTVVLGEHGVSVVGFVLVTQPPTAGGTTGHNVVFGSTGPATTMPISAFEPVGIPSGEMATIGGIRSIGPSGSPLFYIARENKLHGSTLTPSVGAIDEGIGGSTYRATVTTGLSESHDYLTMGGSAGSVVIVHEPGSALYGLWNVPGTEYLPSPDTIPPDDLQTFGGFDGPIGGPAIVQTGADGAYVISVPTADLEGNGTTRLFSVTCVGTERCESPEPLRDLPTRTGRRPEIVRLAPLLGGHAMASIEPDASGRNAAYLYLFDPNWVDVSGTTAPIVPVPTVAGEEVVAIQLGSVSDGVSATLLVAVLIRNESTTSDRIWLGGYRACTLF